MTLFDNPQLTLIFQVAVAMALGAIIGLDREFAHKPAGLRTHMLVAGASALLLGLGGVLVGQFGSMLGADLIQSDPIRIVGAIITGVSFLGAGTIIRHGQDGAVEGLTTAASLLFAAGLGMCVALSQYLLALGVTLLVLVTLRGVTLLSRWLRQRVHPQKDS